MIGEANTSENHPPRAISSNTTTYFQTQLPVPEPGWPGQEQVVTTGPAMNRNTAPAPAPVPTPLPEGRPSTTEHNPDTSCATTSVKQQAFPQPKLRLEIRDLDHPGAVAFLASLSPTACLNHAVRSIQTLLYHTPTTPTTTVPPTRSVTIILRDMPGVAYTTGTDLDPEHHKEIHVSLPYVARQTEARCCDEMTGVLTHELVHCYQYNGHGTCPSGLIEGIADWVRLRCRLGPPHWRRRVDGDRRWDKGYECTAYFLDYLEGRFGDGTVRRVNEKLRLQKYEERHFWTELFGQPVDELWSDYCRTVQEDR